jgi:hypothetical protein
MQKQMGKIGTIRRELHGNACPFCGGHKYRLVLRPNMEPQTGELFARWSKSSVLAHLMKPSAA